MNIVMLHEKSNFKYSSVKKNADIVKALDLIGFHSMLKDQGYKFVRETDTHIILEKLFLRRQKDAGVYYMNRLLAIFKT